MEYTVINYLFDKGETVSEGICFTSQSKVTIPFVRSFVRTSFRRVECASSFALKFLKWCISQQLLTRKHSYMDHSYPGRLAP